MMQTGLLFTLLFAFATAAQSQIVKGTRLVGVNFNLIDRASQRDTTRVEEKGGGISVSIGLAVNENKIVGIELLYGKGRDSDPAMGFKDVSYGGGVFYRVYRPLTNNFYLFGQGVLRYRKSKTDSKLGRDNVEKVRYESLHLNFFPGIAYAVNKRIHFEVTLIDLLAFQYVSGKTTYITPTWQSSRAGRSFKVSTPLGNTFEAGLGFRFTF